MQEHLNQHNMMCFPVVNILMDHEEHAPLVAHRLHAHVRYATPPPSSISTYVECPLKYFMLHYLLQIPTNTLVYLLIQF
jgi:hypothetical protein